jgi:hypothetical protein
MAGDIEFGPGRTWSAASWLFDWVVATIASKIEDVELAAELKGIVGENLGYLPLMEFPYSQRMQLVGVLRSGVLISEATPLPDSLVSGSNLLQVVQELVELAWEIEN